MSLGSILSNATSGLLAQQAIVNTASQNISNASTEGYSRQRVILSPATPLDTPQGYLGRGVTIDTIQRVRSSFLDAQYRTANGQLQQQTSTKDLLDQVQGVMGDLQSGNLAQGLDNFYNAFSDLANDPSSVTTRSIAIQSAGDLARQFQSLNDGLAQTASTGRDQLSAAVSTVNALTKKITDLNQQIVVTSSGQGGASPDLQDQRDLAIDQLSQYVQVRTITQADGSATVLAGDFVVADAAHAETMQVTVAPNGASQVGFQNGATSFSTNGGSIAGILSVVNTVVPALQGQLNTLANAVVTRVNALHQAGTTTGGTTGIPLFDPAGTTAATIAVSSQVSSNSANLVTGTTTAPGDNTVAQQIAQLRTETQAGLGGVTFGDYYASISSTVATQANQVASQVTAQQAVVSNVTSQRASVSGVSIEEEMTTLLRAQQGYAAAAKVVTTVNTMMQSLIQMV